MMNFKAGGVHKAHQAYPMVANLWFVRARPFLNAEYQAKKQKQYFISIWYNSAGIWIADLIHSERTLKPWHTESGFEFWSYE